jgi:hypothetical protein
MQKVIPLIIYFKTVFYLEFFKFRKTSFNSKVGTDLNVYRNSFYLNPAAPHGSCPFSLSIPASWAPPLGWPPAAAPSSFSLCQRVPPSGRSHPTTTSPSLSLSSAFSLLAHCPTPLHRAHSELQSRVATAPRVLSLLPFFPRVPEYFSPFLPRGAAPSSPRPHRPRACFGRY